MKGKINRKKEQQNKAKLFGKLLSSSQRIFMTQWTSLIYPSGCNLQNHGSHKRTNRDGSKLFDNGMAYDTPEAVYFDVAKFPKYGESFGQKLSDKELGYVRS